MHILSELAIFHFEVCSHIPERKHLRLPKNVYSILRPLLVESSVIVIFYSVF